MLRASLNWQPDLPAELATVLTEPAVPVEAGGPVAGLGAVKGAGAGAMAGPRELASPAATFSVSGRFCNQKTNARRYLKCGVTSCEIPQLDGHHSPEIQQNTIGTIRSVA